MLSSPVSVLRGISRFLAPTNLLRHLFVPTLSEFLSFTHSYIMLSGRSGCVAWAQDRLFGGRSFQNPDSLALQRCNLTPNPTTLPSCHIPGPTHHVDVSCQLTLIVSQRGFQIIFCHCEQSYKSFLSLDWVQNVIFPGWDWLNGKKQNNSPWASLVFEPGGPGLSAAWLMMNSEIMVWLQPTPSLHTKIPHQRHNDGLSISRHCRHIAAPQCVYWQRAGIPDSDL